MRGQGKSNGLIQEIIILAVARITNRGFFGKKDEILQSGRTSLYSAESQQGEKKKKQMLGSPTALNPKPATAFEEYFILM